MGARSARIVLAVARRHAVAAGIALDRRLSERRARALLAVARECALVTGVTLDWLLSRHRQVAPFGGTAEAAELNDQVRALLGEIEIEHVRRVPLRAEPTSCRPELGVARLGWRVQGGRT